MASKVANPFAAKFLIINCQLINCQFKERISKMKTYWNTTEGLSQLQEWQPNCWIQVTCPTDDDQRELEERFGIPDYFISDISDTDERARYEYDDGWMLIILRIPYVKEVRSRTPYTTVPLGIIHKRDVTITVCYYETNMMIDFVSYQQKRNEGFTDHVDMIFRLFLSSAVWYLKRLKQINLLIDKAKRNLDKEVNNESLIGLSRLQDSLTYFQTSIRGNETLLSKLKFKLQIDELDADLIEDVNIEMTQARETTSIYSNILESTMDTYQSIINNNMNTVMRTLTSVTIIMMFPTLIASLFGMNLINGMESNHFGFVFALFISVGVSALAWWIFRYKRLI
jgi:magnesium transporter